MDLLDALGFSGIDASLYASLTEYAGVWQPEHGVALLMEPDEKDPGLLLLSLSAECINRRVRESGAGYLDFVDVKHCGVPEGVSAVQSLMLYNGGFHSDSAQWIRLSETDFDDLAHRVRGLCGYE